MKHFLLLITLIFGLVQSFSCDAQSYHVQSITSEDGLSHDYVASLLQDSRGLIWIGTFYGLNRYDGYRIKSYLPNLLDPWSLHATAITCMAENKDGLLWLGTDKGVAVFNPYTEKFVLLSEITEKAPAGLIRDIFIDEEENIWCYSNASGVGVVYSIEAPETLATYLGSTTADTPSPIVQTINFPEKISHTLRLFLRTDSYTCLIADVNSFYELDLRTKIIKKTKRPPSSRISGSTRSTLLFTNHNFTDQTALQDGIAILSPTDPSRPDYVFQFFNKNIYRLARGQAPLTADALKQSDIVATLDQPQSFARMLDCSGRIWVGTIGSGVRIVEPIPASFDYLFPEISFSNPSVMPEGQLWGGMYSPNKLLDLSTATISTPVWTGYIQPPLSVTSALYDSVSHIIYLVLSHPDQSLQLARFDLSDNRLRILKRLKHYSPGPIILYKDSQSSLWLAGNVGEIIRYRPNNQLLDHWDLSYLIPSKETQRREMSRSIAEDSKKRIWIAGDNGLIMVDPSGSKPRFGAFHNQGTDGPIFKNSFIFSVYPDPQNPDLLWLGTLSDGFAKFDTRTGEVEYVSARSNQQFNIVSGIIPDQSGNLWLMTEKGIFHYLVADDIFVNYSKLNHIPRLISNAAASLKTPSGDILFGSNNGLIRVDPRSIPSSTSQGQLLLSDVSINRQPMPIGILQNKIRLDDRKQYFLQLSHDDQFISLEFSVPKAANPASVQYRYKVEGLHDAWIYLGHDRRIDFTELSSGSYNVEIQAIESFDTWANAMKLNVPLKISPPWYTSILAWVCYALLLVIVVRRIIEHKQRRLALQFTADFNQKEMERLQSMDNFKNRFFAYLAHEFKTPLAIIMGNGYKLRTLHPPSTIAYPEAILREGNNMLYLINELIDVTRLHDKSIQLHYEHRDLIDLLNKTVASYQPLLEINQLHLSTDYAHAKYVMNFDPLRTQYVLNNLLSNAIRYTPAQGHIILSLAPLESDRVLIRVTDNGRGIPPEKLPHVFDKYYRAFENDNSYQNFGLGLSFVKELTDLLGAEISVDSKPGEGTTFSLILPVKAPEGVQVREIDELAEEQTRTTIFMNTLKAAADAPSLLIVDDHPTIQSYLKSILQPNFQLIIANNGQEGFDTAIEEIPDLILTDVMMPVMDGIEMTTKLKSNPLTSHIPVVMLSAKNEIQDRLKGQQQGADVYMGKPFHEQELLVALHNLHKLQQQWKNRYASVVDGRESLQKKEPMPDTFSPDSVAQNDLFVQQMLDIFEANYSSVNFDALDLAAALKISKAQLYRKISKISDEGAMSMLRTFRLNKAVILLENHPQMSTKQIAYQVGFKEYSHFSSSFKKHFQHSPSEWRKLKK